MSSSVGEILSALSINICVAKELPIQEREFLLKELSKHPTQSTEG